MAEIKIEKKAPIWPWILGLIILAAIIYYFAFYKKDNVITNDVTTEEVVTTQEAIPAPVAGTLENVPEINQYIDYIDNPKMGVDHDYTSMAITKLVAATRATATALNVDINADLTEADAKANEITKNPKSLDHANMIKDAATIIAKGLKTIQTEKFPSLQSDQSAVDAAVASINVGKPTLDQKDSIMGFFHSAQTLLNNFKN